MDVGRHMYILVYMYMYYIAADCTGISRHGHAPNHRNKMYMKKGVSGRNSTVISCNHVN